MKEINCLSLKEIPAETEKELGKFKPIVRRLLFNRGIKTRIEAEAFIDPIFKTNDPFLMPDMKKAVKRVLRAIANGEKIMIFADYDADGIPGAVVLSDFFEKIGFANFLVEIPDRHYDGFGLNLGAIEKAKKEKVSLIITIDCGTASVLEIDLANKYGIDVLVTDHHEVPNDLPKAVAVVNPKLEKSQYPDRELCGSGVVYKLIEALIEEGDFGLPAGFEKWFLDLVGLATLSDMVPLVGENRVFAKYGLLVLKKTPRLGLGALYSALKLKRSSLTEDDIVFSITPKINVASRLGSAFDAFKLLKTKDEMEAIFLANKLNQINNERKGFVASISKEIKKIIKERNLIEKNVLVVGNPKWRPSLLGLVSGKLAEEYNRPVFLWGRDGEGKIKGSCRAPEGFSVIDIMVKGNNGFLEFGGHAGAGGFSVSDENIHFLPEILEKAVFELQEQAEENNLNDLKHIPYDAFLKLDELSFDFFEEIRSLAPFGMKNHKPLFLLKKAVVVTTRIFGKNKEHLSVLFSDELRRLEIEGISFFASNYVREYFETGKALDVPVHLEKDFFGRNEKLRLRLAVEYLD